MIDIVTKSTPSGFEFTELYTYRGSKGEELGAVARYDAIIGTKKIFLPFTYSEDGKKIVRKAFATPRPLYGLNLLAERPEAPVLVVEGEKAANAARERIAEFVVVTSPNGAKAASKADWSPLADRSVTIWPDHDEAGVGYAAAVTKILPQAKTVKVPTDFPVSWDLADDLPPGVTSEDISLTLIGQHTAAEIAEMFPHVAEKVLDERKKKKTNGSAELRASLDEVIAKADAERLETAPTLDEVLGSVSEFLARFVCYPSTHARVAHTLWIAHCHLMEAWHTTPRLAFMSAEKESGKTRALEITEMLVPNPVLSINSSPAATVTMVSLGMVSILYDEIDSLYGSTKAQEQNAELCAIMNGGYRRGAYIHRCVMQGSIRQVEKLPSFAPLAIAELRTLPDTLASRSIMIRMRRRAPDEPIEQLRLRKVRAPAEALYNDLALRCREIEKAMIVAEPSMPAEIIDRAAECWEPLCAIADAAGGTWPKAARAAAIALKRGAADDLQSKGVLLLQHIREAFMGENKVSTDVLLSRLKNRAESPWNEKGRELGDMGLASILRPYGVKSRDVWIGGKSLKGYRAEDLQDAWNRYLAPCPHDTRETRETREDIDNNNNNFAPLAPLAGSTGGSDLDREDIDDLEMPDFLRRRPQDREERISTMMSVDGFTREQAEAALGWEDQA